MRPNFKILSQNMWLKEFLKIYIKINKNIWKIYVDVNYNKNFTKGNKQTKE